MSTMEGVPEIVEEPIELVPCTNCGRTFAKTSLERHFNICVKTSMSPHHRVKFDSAKMRIHGTELEVYMPPPPIKSPTRPRSRSMPGGNRRGSTGSVQHEQCQFCGRSFGEKAIDRHREWCENHMYLQQRQPIIYTSAHERMQARTKYQAPLTKSLRTRTKEKYSPISGPYQRDNRSVSPAFSMREFRAVSPAPSRASLREYRAVSPALSHLTTRSEYRPESPAPRRRNTEPKAAVKNNSSTRPHREIVRSSPAKALNENKYDVFLSAERQLKELGLLNACESPVLSRRVSSPANLTDKRKSTESSPSPDSYRAAVQRASCPAVLHEKQRSLSPLSYHSQQHSPSSSSHASTELLIIEDEEEQLIKQLAQEVAAEKALVNRVNITPSDLNNDKTEPQMEKVDYCKNKTQAVEVTVSNQEMKSDAFKKEQYDREEIMMVQQISVIQEERSLSTRSSAEEMPAVKESPISYQTPTKSNEAIRNGEGSKKQHDSCWRNNGLYTTDVTNTTDAEAVFRTLKAKLERPDVTKEPGEEDDCPLTQSLQYLDAALSLFQLDDIPVRPAGAPRSKASTKRHLYSTASPLSLLSPDPALINDSVDSKCGACGTPFPLPSARFCCLCGTKRPLPA